MKSSDPEKPLKIIQDLKRIRTELGLTHEELGRRSGYSINAIKDCERGTRIPHLLHFFQWVDALGYDVVLERRPIDVFSETIDWRATLLDQIKKRELEKS